MSAFLCEGLCSIKTLKFLSWELAGQVGYPKAIVMYRVIKRSLKRIFTQEELWAGNRESIKKTFFSKQSIILWSWQTYSTRKDQYLKFMQDPDFKHIKVIRFKTPKEAQNFLRNH